MARATLQKTLPALAMAGLLASCAAVPTPGQKRFERSLDVVAQGETHGMDPIAAAAFWGTRYDRAPNNAKTAVEFSRALRIVGNDGEALRVISHAKARLGDDPDLMLEYGKTLIANDRPHEAVRPIQAAIALGKAEDWTAHSAHGVALDRTGEHRQAIFAYDRALALSPNQPQVLNNKGLSYALAGRRRLAEDTLRTATSVPGGTSQIRQNYALVLALTGKTEMAERLARSDLPPSIADGNVAYYRNLVAQPVYWQGLEGDNVVQPDFGDDPSAVSLTKKSQPVLNPGGPTRRRPAPAPTVTPAPKAPAPEAPRPSASAATGASGTKSIAATAEPAKLSYEE